MNTLTFDKGLIKEIQEWAYVYFVKFTKGRPLFVSKKNKEVQQMTEKMTEIKIEDWSESYHDYDYLCTMRGVTYCVELDIFWGDKIWIKGQGRSNYQKVAQELGGKFDFIINKVKQYRQEKIKARLESLKNKPRTRIQAGEPTAEELLESWLGNDYVNQ